MGYGALSFSADPQSTISVKNITGDGTGQVDIFNGQALQAQGIAGITYASVKTAPRTPFLLPFIPLASPSLAFPSPYSISLTFFR